MKMWSPNRLILSAFSLIFTLFGLWALSVRYASPGVASVTLQVASACSIVFFGCQIFCSIKASERFIYRLIFSTSFGINIFWLFLSLTLPIYITNSLSFEFKLLFGLSFIAIVAYHVTSTINDFYLSFNDEKKVELRRLIKRDKDLTDWRCIDKSSKTEFKIYFPSSLKKWDWAIYFLLTISMVGGFSFRKAYPIPSLIAWSIPFLLLASFAIGMICYRILQIKIIKNIELETGSYIS